MSSRWLKLVELHVEKGVLGLAAVCLLLMLWGYLIRTPHKVKYGNRELGPRELAESIKQDADDLERKMRAADMEVPKVEAFSERLKTQHNQGILAKAAKGAGPALAPELPLATTYGREIVVPGLKDAEEASGSIVLVTPLKPSQPKLRTGRSLAAREPLRVAAFEEPSAAESPGEPIEAEEVAWVTAAAYFDKKAQYNEMIAAGYAPYRSKAYVAGLDVQRQEVLSTGEFSDWQRVRAGKAMPQVDLPEPLFDDETGELNNKDEIRQAFANVKAAQPDLMQPPFYDVELGDFWEVPPIKGYEDDDEEEEEEAEEALGMRANPQEGGIRGAPPRRSTGSRRGEGVRGRSSVRGGGPRGGGGEGRRGGGYPSAAAGRSDADEQRAARREIRESLTEAKKLLGQKDYPQARELAERVLGNQHASKGHERKAKDIIRIADRWLELESERGEGSRGMRGRGAGRSGGEAQELITHPETDAPAVWFHDDTVEAGKTYRYRMRVKLWNRYVGRTRAMRDPEGAKQPVVVGEWSFPSEPVTVTPSTYFFFSGARPGDDVASTDVWKWRKGRWMKERFDVTVGDVIGGNRNKKTGEYDEEGDEIKANINFTTGAVVLDLRFDETVASRWPGKDGVFSYRERESAIMVYLDPADGQVKEKVLVFDRNSPLHKRLKAEAW